MKRTYAFLLLFATAAALTVAEARSSRAADTPCCNRCLKIYGVPDCWCCDDYCRKPLPAPPPCPPCPAGCCVEGCPRRGLAAGYVNGAGRYVCAPTNPILDFRTVYHLAP